MDLKIVRPHCSLSLACIHCAEDVSDIQLGISIQQLPLSHSEMGSAGRKQFKRTQKCQLNSMIGFLASGHYFLKYFHALPSVQSLKEKG